MPVKFNQSAKYNYLLLDSNFLPKLSDLFHQPK